MRTNTRVVIAWEIKSYYIARNPFIIKLGSWKTLSKTNAAHDLTTTHFPRFPAIGSRVLLPLKSTLNITQKQQNNYFHSLHSYDPRIITHCRLITFPIHIPHCTHTPCMMPQKEREKKSPYTISSDIFQDLFIRLY